MICLNCNKEFEAKRVDSKYCSPSCRLKAFRETDKTETDKLPVIETDNTEPLETDKINAVETIKGSPKPTLNTPEHLKEYSDHCHFCNHQFGKAPDGEQLIGYICADCITKAMNSEKQ